MADGGAAGDEVGEVDWTVTLQIINWVPCTPWCCDAFASDLNPVACLILKVMLEDIPRYGPGLADELRRVGAEIKQEAEKELGKFYPSDPDGARPIAYLWARTVRCEAPACGAEIPLVRSFWLSK